MPMSKLVEFPPIWTCCVKSTQISHLRPVCIMCVCVCVCTKSISKLTCLVADQRVGGAVLPRCLFRLAGIRGVRCIGVLCERAPTMLGGPLTLYP